MTRFQGQVYVFSEQNGSGTRDKDQEIFKDFEKSFMRKTNLCQYSHGFAGTLFNEQMKSYVDLNKLPCSFKEQTLKQDNCNFPGITSSYYYVGNYGTVSPIHCEDINLSSVNIMLFGAAKLWIIIPPSEKQKIDALLKGI